MKRALYVLGNLSAGLIVVILLTILLLFALAVAYVMLPWVLPR